MSNDEDVPGNINYTGDEAFNATIQRTGVDRFDEDGKTLGAQHKGGFVPYANYCAAIRTKVSTIRHSERLWNALVLLAGKVEKEQAEEAINLNKHCAEDILTAYERSGDQEFTEHYRNWKPRE